MPWDHYLYQGEHPCCHATSFPRYHRRPLPATLISVVYRQRQNLNFASERQRFTASYSSAALPWDHYLYQGEYPCYHATSFPRYHRRPPPATLISVVYRQRQNLNFASERQRFTASYSSAALPCDHYLYQGEHPCCHATSFPRYHRRPPPATLISVVYRQRQNLNFGSERQRFTASYSSAALTWDHYLYQGEHPCCHATSFPRYHRRPPPATLISVVYRQRQNLNFGSERQRFTASYSSAALPWDHYLYQGEYPCCHATSFLRYHRPPPATLISVVYRQRQNLNFASERQRFTASYSEHKTQLTQTILFFKKTFKRLTLLHRQSSLDNKKQIFQGTQSLIHNEYTSS